MFSLRLSFLVLALSCAAAASGVEPVSSPAIGQVADLTRERVERFLILFISPDKSPAEQAALFTEDANYYKRGPVGRAAILKDIEYSARRWQWRKFTLAGIDDIQRDIDASADRVFVRYRVKFEVSNASRNISGVAAYRATIADLSTQPRVEAIEETVLERNSASTLAD